MIAMITFSSAIGVGLLACVAVAVVRAAARWRRDDRQEPPDWGGMQW